MNIELTSYLILYLINFIKFLCSKVYNYHLNKYSKGSVSLYFRQKNMGYKSPYSRIFTFYPTHLLQRA